jgi:acetyl-CoA carboxylase biotin carboxyl carrier protein
MDYKQIRELLEWIEKSSLTSVWINIGDLNISASKVCSSEVSVGDGGLRARTAMAVGSDEGHVVVSPIVGTFYVSGSPDGAPLAPVGKKVKKGDVLCILEAMKIMNEVLAEVDGVVAEVYVIDGVMVEALQPLFRISAV